MTHAEFSADQPTERPCSRKLAALVALALAVVTASLITCWGQVHQHGQAIAAFTNEVVDAKEGNELGVPLTDRKRSTSREPALRGDWEYRVQEFKRGDEASADVRLDRPANTITSNRPIDRYMPIVVLAAVLLLSSSAVAIAYRDRRRTPLPGSETK